MLTFQRRKPAQQKDQPASAKRSRSKPAARSRLVLEQLEDRLTPSGLDFFPVADVAINPGQLPPTALVQFDPLPNLASATAGTTTEQIQLVGTLSKEIIIPSATAGTPGQMWTLDAFYNLTANVTETIISPSPFAAGSYNATFSMTGTVTELQTQGDDKVVLHQFSDFAVVHMGARLSDHATATVVDVLTWNAQITENGTETPILLPPGSSNMPWNVQATIQSTGMLQEVLTPPGPAPMAAPLTASFWQQDQVTECLMPVIPFHPPSPCITINETFSAWGSVTETMLFPQTAFTPEVDTGTSQYQVQISETILMPDCSMQMVMQNSMDMGTFFEIKEWS